MASACRSQCFSSFTAFAVLPFVPRRLTLNRCPRKRVLNSKSCSPAPRLIPTTVFISSPSLGLHGNWSAALAGAAAPESGLAAGPVRPRAGPSPPPQIVRRYLDRTRGETGETLTFVYLRARERGSALRFGAS